jgi:hypothetical protein
VREKEREREGGREREKARERERVKERESAREQERDRQSTSHASCSVCLSLARSCSVCLSRLNFGIAGGGVELQVVDFARLRITPAKQKNGEHSNQ